MTITRSFNLGFDRYSGLYLWAMFIVVFGVWKPDLFLTTGTLHSVAAQQAIIAMMALGVLVPLAAGVYDLSVGATINFSTILVSILQVKYGWGMWPAIVAVVVVAAVIGVVNGFLVARLGVSSFIATLGTASVIGASQAIVSGQKQPVPAQGEAWLNLTQYKVFGFQMVVLYMLALALILWWAMEHTPAGRYVYAVGGNIEAARLSGVRVARWTWLSLIASATICGIAGVLYASLSGPALTFGPGLLLPAYAAAFLGSTQFRPGVFNVWGSILAVYVLATGVKGLQLVTSVQWLSQMFNGIALILAVSFAVWGQRRTAEKRAVRRWNGPAPGEPDERVVQPAEPSGSDRRTLATTGADERSA